MKFIDLYNSDNLVMWLQLQFQRIYFGSSEGGGNKKRYNFLVYGLKILFVNVHNTPAKTTETGLGRHVPDSFFQYGNRSHGIGLLHGYGQSVR
jgi:hypothetical protein